MIGASAPVEEEASGSMTGSVASLHPSYGFIDADSGAGRFFFHRNDVTGALEFEHLMVGDRVTFESVPAAPGRLPSARELRWVGAGQP